MASPRVVVQMTGLVAGPMLAGLCYLVLPHEYRGPAGDMVAFTHAGRATLAVMTWMAVWWLSEAIDLSATALLPVALLPALRAATVVEATAPYADQIIFLFLGGFLLALSMQRWGLDRRIALATLRLVGDRPTSIVGGVMAVTAVLSMFVSNTATAAMMLPIALSVVDLLRRSGPGGQALPPGRDNLAVCLMLGIAYAASIGGIGTKIGTPPNGILIGYLARSFDHDIDFVSWLKLAMPLVVVFAPLSWLLLTRVLYPVPHARIDGARELVQEQYGRLGTVKPGEWATFIVFTLTAIGWMTRPILAGGAGGIPPLAPGLSDAGIVIIGAMLLFVIPVGRAVEGEIRFVMDWETARKVPWGILILFGGGLSLAQAVHHNGVAEFIGSRTTAITGVHPVIVVLVVTTMVIFLTELTSNTATTATLVPVLAALAPGLGVHPYLLIFPTAIAASCAFMLPVATPPNAIVFGSGHLRISQMVKAGLWLNLIGVVLVTLLTFAVIRPQLVAEATG